MIILLKSSSEVVQGLKKKLVFGNIESCANTLYYHCNVWIHYFKYINTRGKLLEHIILLWELSQICLKCDLLYHRVQRT